MMLGVYDYTVVLTKVESNVTGKGLSSSDANKR